jgi:hypothetical protein
MSYPDNYKFSTFDRWYGVTKKMKRWEIHSVVFIIKHKKAIILSIFIAVIYILFTTCETNNPRVITVERATRIAQPYFYELYGKSIIVKNVSHDVVGMIGRNHLYRNFITVSDGETEYTLVLDKYNKPLSDSFTATEAINSIDLLLFGARIKPLGFKLREHYELRTVFSLYNSRYSVNLTIVTEGLPNRDSRDSLYLLIEELNDKGFDKLIIEIDAPSFLILVHGAHGKRIITTSYGTDIDIDSFTDQYYSLVDSVYWDKQKFDEKIIELADIGYQKVFFYLEQSHETNTIEIVLNCESDISLSGDQAAVLLEGMDDSYFRMADSEIKYTLNHSYQ